jgi:hypothetical protein
MSKRDSERGGYGVLYLSHRKTAVGKGYPDISGICPRGSETPDQRVLWVGNSNSETPGIRPDTPDSLSGHSGLEPGHSGLDNEFHRKSLLNGRIVSHGFCRLF